MLQPRASVAQHMPFTFEQTVGKTGTWRSHMLATWRSHMLATWRSHVLATWCSQTAKLGTDPHGPQTIHSREN